MAWFPFCRTTIYRIDCSDRTIGFTADMLLGTEAVTASLIEDRPAVEVVIAIRRDWVCKTFPLRPLHVQCVLRNPARHASGLLAYARTVWKGQAASKHVPPDLPSVTIKRVYVHSHGFAAGLRNVVSALATAASPVAAAQ